MRIAFVIYNYSESKGGVERYAYHLAEYLAKEGNEIHIFCHQAFEQPKSDRIILHTVPAFPFYPPLKYFFFARNVAGMLKEDKFDIIQHFGRTYYQDARLTGSSARQVYRVGSGCHWEYLKHRHPSMKNIFGRAIQYLNPRNRIIMSLEKKSFDSGAYKKIICISNKVKEEVQRYYHIPDEDINVIYNGIDLARFNPSGKNKYRAETRNELGITENEVVLLFVGSGFERKGLRYAIEGLAAVPENLRAPLERTIIRDKDKHISPHPDRELSNAPRGTSGLRSSENLLLRANIKLLVIGKGNVNKYQALAKRHGIGNQVLFPGAQSQIERYYAASDILLFPTLYEPFGNVCLEAMASGLPVITTRIAGASEIINNAIDSFIIDEPSDTKAIAEKIIFLLDKVWRENMGKVASLCASKYSMENNFKAVKEVYNQNYSAPHTLPPRR
ncbi:MAG: glycosyltransferase family 4 protein [Planctomycetota bacterium]